MKKTFALLVLCVMVGTLAVSCASIFVQHDVNFSQVNGDSVKVGQAESRVWLGYFGERSYPTIKEAADNGGITKIATVEYYAKPGILWIWTDYFTIVTGE
jgi:hypothetical protein